MLRKTASMLLPAFMLTVMSLASRGQVTATAATADPLTFENLTAEPEAVSF